MSKKDENEKKKKTWKKMLFANSIRTTRISYFVFMFNFKYEMFKTTKNLNIKAGGQAIKKECRTEKKNT